MNMETKREVFARYKKQYFKARALKRGGKKILTAILNMVCEVTGLQRKAAIRKFSRLQVKSSSVETRGRPLYYTPDVTAALKEVWEAGGEVCGELLHHMIQEYILIFEKDRMWKHSG